MTQSAVMTVGTGFLTHVSCLRDLILHTCPRLEPRLGVTWNCSSAGDGICPQPIKRYTLVSSRSLGRRSFGNRTSLHPKPTRVPRLIHLNDRLHKEHRSVSLLLLRSRIRSILHAQAYTSWSTSSILTSLHTDTITNEIFQQHGHYVENR